jgi:hypothetical protein
MMAGAAEYLQVMHSFQHAVAVAPHDPGWRTHVGELLSGLRRAFAEHVGVTEGPNGLYHELLDEAPRLASGVHGLVREHENLLAAMEGLHARVSADEYTGEPEISTRDIDQVRGWARDLLRELYEHRQRGADLVYEAYGTDIGGET